MIVRCKHRKGSYVANRHFQSSMQTDKSRGGTVRGNIMLVDTSFNLLAEQPGCLADRERDFAFDFR